jgi:Cu(I)/Ag(I) efflux system membrane protein CusA/SilA
VKIPGLSNIWIPPIRNRIDMLATGIKSPIGVKVTGNDLAVIDRIATRVEQVAKSGPGVSSALAERLTGGRYVDVQIDRDAAARYGLNIADMQALSSPARLGAKTSARPSRGWRASRSICATRGNGATRPNAWQQLAHLHAHGSADHAGHVARISITDGPPMLKSENARPSGWVYVDVRGRDLQAVAKDLRRCGEQPGASWSPASASPTPASSSTWSVPMPA